MTLEETIDLLSVAAAYDRRTTGKADAIAWHAALSDLSFGDCRAAVVNHYSITREWVMPSDIRQHAETARRQRLDDTEVPAPPPELLDNPPAYIAHLRKTLRAIGDGVPERKALGS